MPIEHAQRHLNALQVAELTSCGRTFADLKGVQPLKHLQKQPGRAMRRELHVCMQLWPSGLVLVSSEVAAPARQASCALAPPKDRVHPLCMPAGEPEPGRERLPSRPVS